MEKELKNVVIAGAGAIGTALAQAMAVDSRLNIQLLSIEENVIETINSEGVNSKYFPAFKLNPGIRATSDKNILQTAHIVFLALPSVAVIGFIEENIDQFSSSVILVNLAKGFSPTHTTIAEQMISSFPFASATMKGPTFARELINGSPTAFTVGSNSERVYHKIELLFKNTVIYLDFTKDVKGVELLSILKNIYAIAIGIVDAHFNSANLRFLVLTKAFYEMRSILIEYGGRKPSMFKYCGFGDFGLTALNDLSRNRTLGLLIGKGFFTDTLSEKVLLEGRVAVNIFCEEILKDNSDQYPIMSEMYKVFNQSYDVTGFVNRILSKD
ncbi:MAG: hypothetical protein Q7J34_10430 [Bacteroidales bacterium]|nr:hypothetical protein [Bacteroidales bacterium]